MITFLDGVRSVYKVHAHAKQKTRPQGEYFNKGLTKLILQQLSNGAMTVADLVVSLEVGSTDIAPLIRQLQLKQKKTITITKQRIAGKEYRVIRLVTDTTSFYTPKKIDAVKNRQDKIISLCTDTVMTIKALVSKLSVSEGTIHNDVNTLVKKGILLASTNKGDCGKQIRAALA